MITKRVVWALTGVVVFAGGVLLAGRAALWRPDVQAWLFRRGFERALVLNASRDAMVRAPELRVVLCGTASPLPNAPRAGPCEAVIAGGHIWVVDVGGGGFRNLMLWHLPVERLAAVLLTHFHSDHIEDLGEANMQSWVAGRPGPLPVYGGPGVADVVEGFTLAYSHDVDYRVAHHGKAALPPESAVMVAHEVSSAPGIALREGATAPVLELDGMKITAIGVNHFPVVPAYGYKFEYGGRTLVISGDTKESAKLAAVANGADVLVHEAQQGVLVQEAHDIVLEHGMTRTAGLLNDIQTYHTMADQAGRVANEAGAKLLVMTHLTPPLPDFFVGPAFMSLVGKERASGVILGYDGLMVSLPPGSDVIDVSTLR